MKGNGQQGNLEAHRRMILAAEVKEIVAFKVMEDDERYPDHLIMGSYLGDKLVGRRVLPKPPPDREKAMRAKGTSSLPDVRPLFLICIEAEVGGLVNGSLQVPSNPMTFAEIPAKQLSVTDLPPMTELGVIVRLKEDRKYRDSFIDECTSIFDKIIEGGTVPQVERILHHLNKAPVKPVGPMMCVHSIPWRECTICRRRD